MRSDDFFPDVVIVKLDYYCFFFFYACMCVITPGKASIFYRKKWQPSHVKGIVNSEGGKFLHFVYSYADICCFYFYRSKLIFVSNSFFMLYRVYWNV